MGKSSESQEIWKDIKGYEGLYEISNYGNVRSLDRSIITKTGFVKKRKGCILSKAKLKNGYLVICLSLNGVQKNHYIHRLVAHHFVKNPKQLNIVNHIDSNRENNYFKNLEWVTPQENTQHAISTGLFSIEQNRRKHSEWLERRA